MKKSRIPILLLMSAALLFAACSKSGDGGSKGAAESKQANMPEGPLGKYPEPVTLQIGMEVNSTESFGPGNTFDDNIYTRFVKENINIDVTSAWQAQSGKDYEQKVNLSIASNDLPDAMRVNETAFRAMAKSKMLEDLLPSYNVYASSNMKTAFDKTGGLAMDNVSYDGSMLAFPNIPVPDDSYSLVWIRKDWLDALGLDVPKTPEELKAVARAFVENDMSGTGDTIGMAGPQNGGKLYANFMESTNNTWGFDAIFSSKDAYPGFWVEDKSGNTVYGSILPETKTALAFLAGMYAEGLIDPQIGIRKDSSQLMVSGQTGIIGSVWWMGYWPLPDAWANNPEANWQSYMLQDDKGIVNNHMGTVSTQYVVVRKGYEHPETVVLLNDYLLKYESTFDKEQATIGNYPVRVPIAPFDEIKVTNDAMLQVLRGDKTPEDFDKPEYKPYKLLLDDVQKVASVKKAPFDDLDMKYWDRAADPNSHNRLYSLLVGTHPFNSGENEINRVYSKTYSMTKGMETKWANLKKMEDEVFLKIITGAVDIDAFDQFVADWKKQGGDDITREVIDLTN
ncbi:MAG: extracellular solute-binding protein [Spirochaetales bacterium]|nr:extracellular solute-binding protein [Spirochaetales bacterium]